MPHAARHRTNNGGRDLAVSVAASVMILTGGISVTLGLTRHGGPAQPSIAAAGTLDTAPLSTNTPTAQPRPAAAKNARPTAASSPPQLVLSRSRPVALRIPRIKVSSTVGTVGLNPDHSVEVPSGVHYDQPAWYRYSTTPGALGPAVILGHVDRVINGPSVFYRLGQLHPGDTISVTRADGRIAVFVINAVRRYAKSAFPTQAVYGRLDHPGLRLVTCGGSFDSRSGHYLDNIVVFAHLTRATGS